MEKICFRENLYGKKNCFRESLQKKVFRENLKIRIPLGKCGLLVFSLYCFYVYFHIVFFYPNSNQRKNLV